MNSPNLNLSLTKEDFKRIRILQRRPLKANVTFRRVLTQQEKMRRVSDWLQENKEEWKPIIELSNYKCEISN